MAVVPRIIEEELRFKFYNGEAFFLAYNKGYTQYGDMYKSRPDFYPVYSPSGREVTSTCAYRYNHHKSIFIGHADVNGINFFLTTIQPDLTSVTLSWKRISMRLMRAVFTLRHITVG